MLTFLVEISLSALTLPFSFFSTFDSLVLTVSNFASGIFFSNTICLIFSIQDPLETALISLLLNYYFLDLQVMEYLLHSFFKVTNSLLIIICFFIIFNIISFFFLFNIITTFLIILQDFQIHLLVELLSLFQCQVLQEHYLNYLLQEIEHLLLDLVLLQIFLLLLFHL